MQLEGKTFYVDPVGSGQNYKNLPKSDFILITDIHGDHFSTKTLSEIFTDSLKVIAPEAVAEKKPKELQDKAWIMNNGDLWKHKGIQFEAIPYV